MTDQPTTQPVDETTANQAPAASTSTSDNGVAHGTPAPDPIPSASEPQSAEVGHAAPPMEGADAAPLEEVGHAASPTEGADAAAPASETGETTSAADEAGEAAPTAGAAGDSAPAVLETGAAEPGEAQEPSPAAEADEAPEPSPAAEPEDAADTVVAASTPAEEMPSPAPSPAAPQASTPPASPPQASAPEPLPAQAPVVRSALSDPSRWGRVDADRTVYVKTADGERAIGSWQAGEPEEGLLHFARRFDDLLTEVELIEARLASGHGDPKQSMSTIRQLRESLAEAHVVGDVVGLAAKLDYLVAKAEEAASAARQAREAARIEATARKQALVEEAERIATEATQWKVAGDRLRAILDEWKTIRGVDRKTDDALWKRFGKARDAFNRRRGSHFAEMDRQRSAAKARKEEIVAEAESLATSTEWGPTAGRYKQLMTDWKAAGRAQKDADDALWQRFRAAQDAFFSRRSSAFNERDSELTDNARRKEQLLAEAERIDPSGDLEAAKAQLARLQERWDAIGHVPRERMRELESRLRAIEERVRGAADAQWRRSDPEALARVAQFRERVQQFETQAAKARAAGDERRARRAEEQAAQWREWLAAAERAVADR
jgi:Domain of Unknown Function (DUF349)